jgi:hypothetical protein
MSEFVTGLITFVLTALVISLIGTAIGEQNAREELRNECMFNHEIVLYANHKGYRFKCELIGEVDG